MGVSIDGYESDLRCITGEARAIYRLIPLYFDEVVKKIDGELEGLLTPEMGIDKIRTHPHFDHRDYYLVSQKWMENDTYRLESPEQWFDEHLWILKYEDSVVASVIETRDDFNYHRFTFSDNIPNVLRICKKENDRMKRLSSEL